MLDPVTTRYTEALFGLARSRGALDEVRRDVERLSSELMARGTGDFFLDARVPVETRRTKLEPFLVGAHELTRNFVGLLFDKRREEVLRKLGDAFHRKVLDAEGAAEGYVESARALDAGEVARIATVMGRRLGRRLTLENRVNPELVGGVRIVVGSKMIDYSLRGRMEGLRRSMLNAPLPSLQEA